MSRSFAADAFDHEAFDVELWAGVTENAETWTAKTKQAETWIEKTQDAETWTPMPVTVPH